MEEFKHEVDLRNKFHDITGEAATEVRTIFNYVEWLEQMILNKKYRYFSSDEIEQIKADAWNEGYGSGNTGQ